MKVIGLRGKAYSGKDTAYEIIRTKIKCKRKAFGDYLKEEVSRATGISISTIEVHKPRFRPLLQWWGTDFRRWQDKSYWTEKMAYYLNVCRHERYSGTIVITDVRFPDEQQLIKRFKGHIVEVQRLDEPTIKVPNHESETALAGIPPDYILFNDGTQWFASEIEIMLRRLNYIKEE